MNWQQTSPIAALDQLHESATRQYSSLAETPDAVAAWQCGLAPVLARLLTLDRMQPCNLSPRMAGTEDCGTYSVEQVYFQSEPGVEIPAALLVPKSLRAPAPAVLCPPGHGRGITDQLDSDPDGHDGVRALNYDYSRQFAERGYVVLTCEVRGFGFLSDPELSKRGLTGNCDKMFTYALMLGRVLAGIRVWDQMRGIDYLVGREEVDQTRIGCAGLSMGGELAMLVSALDRRVSVSTISGFLCTYHGLIVEHGNCICYTIPGVLDVCDMSDVAGLIAPRPLVIETGQQDGCFPLHAVDEAYGQLERIYRAAGAADMLVRDIHPAGHRFSGEVAFEWFDRWLGVVR